MAAGLVGSTDPRELVTPRWVTSRSEEASDAGPGSRAHAPLQTSLLHGGRFATRIVRRFVRHRGPLLASAIAFDALMSVVPLLALALIATSFVVDAGDVKRLIALQLDVLPAQAIEPISRAYTTLVERRGAAGGLVIAALVVFGTMAFRTVHGAMAVVFESPAQPWRKAVAAAFLPLAFVALIGAGIVVGTLALIVVDAFFDESATSLLRSSLSAAASFGFLLFLFSSFYHFMPVRRPPFRRCLVGGVLAAGTWEIARRAFVWYIGQVSMVGVVYGSLASIVVLLIGFEVAAFVVLLGGEVVAALEQSAREEVPWYLGN
jgi:YihY family inner membrane protein